jgi:hypothetical protein
MSVSYPELQKISEIQIPLSSLKIVKRDGPNPSVNSLHYSLLAEFPDGIRLEYDLPGHVLKHLEVVLADPNLLKDFSVSVVNSFVKRLEDVYRLSKLTI